MQFSFFIYVCVHLLKNFLDYFDNGKNIFQIKFLCCCSSSGSPRLPKVNQYLGDVIWKTEKIGNEEEEKEGSPKQRETLGNGVQPNGNCVDAEMNVVVETHF